LVINLQWERNLEKMFEAVFWEKFDRWTRKYDHQTVLKVWAEMISSEGFRSHFRKGGWKVDITIRAALEVFDDYCQEIENKILEKEKAKCSSMGPGLSSKDDHERWKRGDREPILICPLFSRRFI